MHSIRCCGIGRPKSSLFQHQQGGTNLHLVCPWPPSLGSEVGWKPRQSNNYAKQWSSTNDFAHIYIVFHDPKSLFSIIQKFLSTFPVHLVGNVNSWLCTHIFNIFYKYNKQYYFFTLTHHNYKKSFKKIKLIFF